MRLITPTKRASGLGQTKTGFYHWWLQRLTAVALIPLTVWAVFSLVGLAGQDYPTVKAWFAQSHHALLSLLFIVTAIYHTSLGLQVIVEDYIHHLFLKQTVLIMLNLLLVLLGTLCAVLLFRLVFVH